jgi:pimeloyl-ACP methyl ester carboxylesterase
MHEEKQLPTLLMLHGSRGTLQQLSPLAEATKPYCSPLLINLQGHGGRPVPDRFTVESMARDVLQQMDGRQIEQTYLFGYSFGGYIALYLAKHAPDRIRGVCTLSVKVDFDQKTVALWTRLSSADRIRRLQKDVMDERHPGQDWDRLVNGLADLYRQLGETPTLTDDDFRAINIPTLIMAASNDQLVPWLESLHLTYLMPKGQGFTFAGEAHPIDVIPPEFLASVIGGWLASLRGMGGVVT